jgi:hypothetical protein
MSGTLRSHLRKFLQGRPGRRFIELHRSRKAHATTGEGAGKRLLYVGAGLALLLAGLLLSLPPGFPGFLLWFPGLVMLVSRLKAMALLLDRVELALRRLIARLSR